jgi:sensor histidine kinase YesM
MQRTKSILLKAAFLLMTTAIMAASFYFMANAERGAASVKGQLDLSHYDFESQGMLTLDGEWQFFYNRFIEPVKFSDLSPVDKPDLYITPPTLWNYYEIDGKPIPGFGCGTYRTVVTGVKPGVPLGLKILPESTAYDLYIDGYLLASNGTASERKDQSAPGYHPHSVFFTPQNSEFVITIHISNFVFARGGMWDAPTLGTKTQINNLDRFLMQRDMFMIGCYFIAFLIFLVIFITRPSNRSWLYFALLCVVATSRILIYGSHVLTFYTENFRLITFLEYSTRLWYPVLLLLLLNTALNGKLPKKLLAGMTLFITAATAAVAILPIHIYTSFARAVMLYNFLLGLAMLVMMLWPGQRFFPRNKDKIFFIYGISAILVSGLYDMFFAATAFFEMNPVGFFGALLAFAFILSITYTDALTDCENALDELEAESTRKLQTELKLLQSQIRPHFLYNALSAIANVCRKDGQKAEELILDLAYFMQNSFDFSSSEKLTTLENELEYIRKYVHIEEVRFGDKVKYTEMIEAPLTTQLPRLIIEPIVENAIRHGILKKKGGGEVRLHIHEVPGGTCVEVIDNGIGMSREKLAEVFTDDSKSVGLKNIQDRLIRLNKEGLAIESVLMEYTKVSFILKREG